MTAPAEEKISLSQNQAVQDGRVIPVNPDEKYLNEISSNYGPR